MHTPALTVGPEHHEGPQRHPAVLGPLAQQPGCVGTEGGVAGHGAEVPDARDVRGNEHVHRQLAAVPQAEEGPEGGEGGCRAHNRSEAHPKPAI